jgi:VCBS repeat-containing protein
MAVPVVTLPGNINLVTVIEFANTTGSAVNRHAGINGTVTDDNVTNYLLTTAFVPNPVIVPGSYKAKTFMTNFATPLPGHATGTIAFTYDVLDRNLDFLKQNEVRIEHFDVTIRDNATGEAKLQRFDVRVIGTNDKPTARVDLQTVSENVTTVKNLVLGNDTDPDFGDSKALTASGFQVFSVTSAAAPYLTKAMVAATRVNFTNNALPLKDAIQVSLDRAFQGLTTGENALIVIKYGMVDGWGATSASELRLTVTGSPDTQIVGTNANDLFLFGEKDADQIFALAGNDTVFPRGGNDTITLGAGFDTIVFNTPLGATANKDTITDFNPAQDAMKLENAIFTKLVAVGPLRPAFFRAGAAALDANDHIVYNKATGGLFYDVNGNAAGGAIQFATLLNKPTLTYADFVVV